MSNYICRRSPGAAENHYVTSVELKKVMHHQGLVAVCKCGWSNNVVASTEKFAVQRFYIEHRGKNILIAEMLADLYMTLKDHE